MDLIDLRTRINYKSGNGNQYYLSTECFKVI